MDLAPWLQAFAAVVQGIVALVIMRLTRRLTTATEEYVHLTREVANAARVQQQAQSAREAADRVQFATLVQRLRKRVSELPEPERARLRSAELVDIGPRLEGECVALAARGAALGLTDEASLAAEHLRGLGNLVGQSLRFPLSSRLRVEDYPPELHAEWENFPWDDYGAHLSGAREALDRLHGFLMATLEKGTLGNLAERAGRAPRA
jgi:hypothetical protein